MTLANPSAPAAASNGSDFAPLLANVRAQGLLRTRRRRYALIIGSDLVAFTAVWVVLWFVGNTWWQLFLALPAAIFSVRMVFVGHDIGHRQVARTKRVNRVMGLVVGDVIVGLGADWWIDRHNRHHANPNEVGRDPDVGAGALCWTGEQAAGRTGFLAWFSRHQGHLFLPLLLLEALNLHSSSLRAARRPRDVMLLGVHVILYVALLLAVLGPVKALVFALVHQALVGLHLGCAFAPNHKGMPMPPSGSRWDFLRKQVLTSRNVRGGPVTDWFLGGLNYQIEHHLFPGTPRPHLRKIQPFVRAHCLELGIPYAEASLPKSLSLTIAHLQRVGSESGTAPVHVGA